MRGAGEGFLGQLEADALDFVQDAAGLDRSAPTHRGALTGTLTGGYFETEEARSFLNDFYRKCSQGMPVIMDVFSHDDAVEEAAAYGRLVGVAEENIRECIVNRLGEFIDLWLGFGVDGALSLSGGDTVYAFLLYRKVLLLENF